MKRIYIVTGASGFLGNNIIRMLEHDDNAEVRAFVLNGESISSLNNLKCSIYYGDVTKVDTLNSIFEGSGDAEIFVIHCAAVVYIKSKYNSRVYDVNVNGTKNIVDKVLEYNAKLIYVSSVHAIPEKSNGDLISEVSIFNPDDVVGLYAKTKAEAARYVMDSVKDKGLNACIVHPSGILGPYDFSNSHLTALVREIVRGKLPMCVKGGYDFVDVRDVAKGIIMACDKGKMGECYIMSGEFVSIKKLADLVCDVVGRKRIKVVLPIMIAKIVAPFYEMYYNVKGKTPLFTKYSLYTLSSNSNFSNEKAKRDLGFVTRDITDTVKDMIMWILGDFKE
ncbi:MAG: dihydroflavonol 4-reductase [Clostridiaceae bacterium]|nr:MAG: dihydroflavonol 4-reductase [Clostridiaceae bacterium]